MAKQNTNMSRRGNLLTEPEQYIVDALAAESDRGCVLVAASFIEYATQQLLEKFFYKNIFATPEDAEKRINKLFLGGEKENKLLQSGWAKSTIARCIGLIDEPLDLMCEEVRNLRNSCAHFPGEVELNHDVLKKLLARVPPGMSGAFQQWLDRHADGKSDFFGERQLKGEFSEARVLFMHICVSIETEIRGLAYFVERQPNPYHHGVIGGHWDRHVTEP